MNIIIYSVITIIAYKIIKELLKNEKYVKEKSIILATISSITMASLTNVIYIRMYALATLNILITTYLHIKLYKAKSIDLKLLLCISICTLLGVLTHYYYHILYSNVIFNIWGKIHKK